jgi:tungstate transport system substrate-binding protein
VGRRLGWIRPRLTRVGALLLIAALPACRSEPAIVRLDLATTTSVQHSGLLDAILPAFRGQSGTDVRVHAAGSGRALEMLADGIVDLALTHAPEAESRALQAHSDWRYRKIAYNRFIVVGPPGDPAAAAQADDAVDAFRRIAAARVPFVSRGDGSGTHEREQTLWTLAGAAPDSAALIVSGRGMAQALRHADERRAYTLSDEATFWQFERSLQLVPLVQGDELLLNTYAVVYPESAAAAVLVDWLTSGDGRQRTAAFTVAGRPAFAVWPVGCPGSTPGAAPCPTP